TIAILRKALAESGDNRQYIETVAKHGYRFVANVKELFDDSPEMVVRELTRSSVTIEQEEESIPAAALGRADTQYLIGEIKLHRRGVAIALAAFVVVAA